MATIVKAGVLLAAVRLFGNATLSPSMVELVAILPLVSIVWAISRRCGSEASVA